MQRDGLCLADSMGARTEEPTSQQAHRERLFPSKLPSSIFIKHDFKGSLSGRSLLI
ncbi:MAG: hypothetical protein Q8S24_09485 [Eubacteriales bacterium]|nr:hypothetical protein [Eubacteriales bacterium]